jgi:hypothetical protein
MAKEVVYTTSAPLRAFVTLIFMIASGRPAASRGMDSSITAVDPGEPRAVDCDRVLEILIGPVSCRTQTCSRLVTLGPFLTLILTLRSRQAESDGVYWPGSSLSGSEIESATAL